MSRAGPGTQQVLTIEGSGRVTCGICLFLVIIYLTLEVRKGEGVLSSYLRLLSVETACALKSPMSYVCMREFSDNPLH